MTLNYILTVVPWILSVAFVVWITREHDGRLLGYWLQAKGEPTIVAVREWFKGFGFIAASIAAIFAFWQFDLAKRSGERQDRAYVMIDNAAMLNFSSGQAPDARIEIKNFGRTPAFDVQHVGRCWLSQYPATYGSFIPPEKLFKSKSIIAPTTNNVGFWRCPKLSDDDMKALSNGSKALLIDGLIRYSDAFGKPRKTYYKRMVGGSAGLQGNMIANSEEGDEAD